MRTSILLINLEFLSWARAKNLSYCAQLGLEEGLHAQGVDYFTLPSLWILRAKDLLAGRKFDQVWVEIVQTPWNEESLNWLKNIAPIRVGFLPESTQYSQSEYAMHPFLNGRSDLIHKRLKYFTHLVVCDEVDTELSKKTIPTFWWPQAVPQNFICKSMSAASKDRAIFCGAVYGERKKWLTNPNLKNLLMHCPSDEFKTFLPWEYNFLNLCYVPYMKFNLKISNLSFQNYLITLRRIRRQCFQLWLNNLKKGCAVVNLPHLVKTYAGRVVEAMACGIPTISWEIPDRPRNKGLFENGQDILLFSKDKPDQLIKAICRIKNSPDFGMRLANNAIDKILKYHTIEKRVDQILRWIKFNESPKYYD